MKQIVYQLKEGLLLSGKQHQNGGSKHNIQKISEYNLMRNNSQTAKFSFIRNMHPQTLRGLLFFQSNRVESLSTSCWIRSTEIERNLLSDHMLYLQATTAGLFSTFH